MSNELQLDWVERGILGFLIFLAILILHFLTEVVIFLAILLLAIVVLGFIGEKLINHIVPEEN